MSVKAAGSASSGKPSLIRPFYSKVAQFELRHPTVWVMPDDALDILACHPGSQTITRQLPQSQPSPALRGK